MSSLNYPQPSTQIRLTALAALPPTIALYVLLLTSGRLASTPTTYSVGNYLLMLLVAVEILVVIWPPKRVGSNEIEGLDQCVAAERLVTQCKIINQDDDLATHRFVVRCGDGTSHNVFVAHSTPGKFQATCTPPPGWRRQATAAGNEYLPTRPPGSAPALLAQST